MIRFETYDRMTLRGRRWYFRIVSCGNNEIMTPSEAYNSAAARNRAILIIQHNAADAKIRPGTRA